MEKTKSDTEHVISIIPQKALASIQEINYDAVTARQKLKGSFLERDKLQMSSYIKDLEKTISINKDIINNLVNQQKQEGLSKKIITNLNTENAKLQAHLKTAIKQRDSYQSKLLIAEQIIEDYKGKENTHEKMVKEQAADLLDQLNKKEYVLQNYERKFYRVLTILKKYQDCDCEIKLILREFNMEARNADKKITNVVEENAALVTEVKTARIKMAQLESKLTQLTKMNISPEEHEKTPEKKITDGVNNSPLSHKIMHVGVHQRNNSVFTGNLNSQNEIKLLKDKISQLTEENELIKDALRAMQKKNEELGNELQNLKEENKKLHSKIPPLDNKKDKFAHDPGNPLKTDENIEIKQEAENAIKNPDNSSFEEANSIKGEVIEDFLVEDD